MKTVFRTALATLVLTAFSTVAMPHYAHAMTVDNIKAIRTLVQFKQAFAKATEGVPPKVDGFCRREYFCIVHWYGKNVVAMSKMPPFDDNVPPGEPLSNSLCAYYDDQLTRLCVSDTGTVWSIDSDAHTKTFRAVWPE